MREEDRQLIAGHQAHGNKWANIAKTIIGRTGKAIRGRWSSTLKRKVDEALARARSFIHFFPLHSFICLNYVVLTYIDDEDLLEVEDLASTGIESDSVWVFESL